MLNNEIELMHFEGRADQVLSMFDRIAKRHPEMTLKELYDRGFRSNRKTCSDCYQGSRYRSPDLPGGENV